MLYSWCTLVYPGIPWYTLTVYSTLDILTLNPVYSWAQNLRQGIVMKTSFGTRVSRMRLGSFVDINIFCCEISFYLFSSYFPLFKSFKSKSTIMLRPHKGNSRVSFNDTLLNFGLCLQFISYMHTLFNTYHICTVYRVHTIHARCIKNISYMYTMQYLFYFYTLYRTRRYWIGGGDRVSVHFAVTFHGLLKN